MSRLAITRDTDKKKGNKMEYQKPFFVVAKVGLTPGLEAVIDLRHIGMVIRNKSGVADIMLDGTMLTTDVPHDDMLRFWHHCVDPQIIITN